MLDPPFEVLRNPLGFSLSHFLVLVLNPCSVHVLRRRRMRRERESEVNKEQEDKGQHGQGLSVPVSREKGNGGLAGRRTRRDARRNGGVGHHLSRESGHQLDCNRGQEEA